MTKLNKTQMKKITENNALMNENILRVISSL